MEIKNYLHLYLGCECLITVPDIVTANDLCLKREEPFILTGKLLDYFIDDTTRAKIKPILRPLSDITEDEFLQIFKPVQPNDVTNEQLSDAIANLKADGFDCLDFGDMDAIAVFEIFRKLLSKYFDLFGLCDAGLAIDATTLLNKDQGVAT